MARGGLGVAVQRERYAAPRPHAPWICQPHLPYPSPLSGLIYYNLGDTLEDLRSRLNVLFLQ